MKRTWKLSRRLTPLLTCWMIPVLAASAEDSATTTPEAVPRLTRDERIIEGWHVRVDARLLAAPHESDGRRALQLLEAHLADIASIISPGPLEKIRTTPIILDWSHGKLRQMQYHPSAQWLENNGYARDLAQCVHIPTTSRFISPRTHHEQPWCVLHELAHAYHHQFLGFEEARIRQAWESYKASGRGLKTLHINGSRTDHYALTDQKEFFAEMSEAYFGMNDFFPFNQAELKEAEPEIFELLRTIWGSTP